METFYKSYKLNGTLINKNVYSFINERALAWITYGVFLTATEEGRITLTLGSQEKIFKSIVVKVNDNGKEYENIFVKLDEDKTFILGQFGTKYKAPLYRYE